MDTQFVNLYQVCLKIESVELMCSLMHFTNKLVLGGHLLDKLYSISIKSITDRSIGILVYTHTAL